MYDLEGHQVLYGGKLLEKTCGVSDKWADLHAGNLHCSTALKIALIYKQHMLSSTS